MKETWKNENSGKKEGNPEKEIWKVEIGKWKWWKPWKIKTQEKKQEMQKRKSATENVNGRK